MLSKIKLFLQESRRELNHVNWPSRQDTIRLTFIVIFISIAVALFLGILDFIFASLLRLLIQNG